MTSLFRCIDCGSYTLSTQHCGKPTQSPHPAKYSSQDKYRKYRQEAKRRQGLL